MNEHWERGGRRADLTLVGPRTRAHFKDATGSIRAVTIQFKPGWSMPCLGVAASELTDTHVSLEDIWGNAARELCNELLDLTNMADVAQRIARAIAEHVDEDLEPTSSRIARHAVRLLEGSETRVDVVAHRLGVTPRHLRRAFVENIGVGPKDFARAVRLQRVLSLATRSSDWAQIAVEAGYYDQAHLIVDFRDLVGLTPREYMRRRTHDRCATADERL